MMRRSKRQTLSVLRTFLDKPKWWNEAFAKYDHKRLQESALMGWTSTISPIEPKLTTPEPSFSDQVIMREMYRPFVIKSKFGGVL